MDANVQMIIYAAVGSLVVPILDLVELRKIAKDRRPDFSDIFYWLPYIVYPFLAAFLAYAYLNSKIELNPILAINLGASAPAILQSFARVGTKSSTDIEPDA
jgi:hypothetical protein